ncbi:MAG TPA: type II CAAX endopeptidase family protein [Geothrix sp.]
MFIDDRGAVRNGWKVLGFVVLLNLVGFGTAPLIRLWPAAGRAILPGRWFDAATCLGVTWLCLRAEGNSLAEVGLRPDRRFLGGFALGTLGGFTLMWVTASLIHGLGGFHWVRTPGTGPAVLAAGAWFFLAVACFEEILFRGYAFQRAVRGLGFGGTQLLFALAFAGGHWNNPGMVGATKAWATLNIALAALLLGLCWRRTGSLALPIGVHLGWNWTQGNLLGFGVSGTETPGWWTPVFHGRPEWLTGGAFGLEASAVCAFVSGAAVLGLWWWKGIPPSGGASTVSAS